MAAYGSYHQKALFNPYQELPFDADIAVILGGLA